MYAAIVLMAITLLVNICGAAVLRRATANVTGEDVRQVAMPPGVQDVEPPQLQRSSTDVP